VCSHTPRGRTTDRRHRHRDLLRLTRCRPQRYGGELGSSTNNNVLIIRGRARYITFYITMSRLAVTIVAVTSRRQSRDIVGEGRDCHRGVAATTCRDCSGGADSPTGHDVFESQETRCMKNTGTGTGEVFTENIGTGTGYKKLYRHTPTLNKNSQYVLHYRL